MSDKKEKFYNLGRIKEYNARYNIIFGERSNGKTYAVLEEGYKRFLETGEQTAIIRRWDDDFVGGQSARTSYDSLSCNARGENIIKKLSKGKYTGVSYYGGKYYLTAYDEDKAKDYRTDDVLALAFSLNSSEHYKSASFPKIRTILFDEFIGRTYLVDEFVLFQNVLSTIIRRRDDVTIYMCANTINKFACPYFVEMGIYKYKEMTDGKIDLYTYGESGLRVAVERTDGANSKKASDVYFAFNNPKLKMITSGEWEMDIYPHLPIKYLPKHILLTYFVEFENIIAQCEIIAKENYIFTYVHRKTTEIKDRDKDIIISPEPDGRPNHFRCITHGAYRVNERIAWFFRNDKVFYQDNELGELIRNYIKMYG